MPDALQPNLTLKRGLGTQGEVGCGNWDPNTKKKNVKVWPRLPSDLDIHQVQYTKVWGTASNRNAPAELQTILQGGVSCGTWAWSLWVGLLKINYLNFSTIKITTGIRILPAEILQYRSEILPSSWNPPIPLRNTTAEAQYRTQLSHLHLELGLYFLGFPLRKIPSSYGCWIEDVLIGHLAADILLPVGSASW